jgi:DNA-binding transcriptional MerR regulator
LTSDGNGEWAMLALNFPQPVLLPVFCKRVGYLCFTMAKSLSQIAFDFSAMDMPSPPEVNEALPAEVAPAEVVSPMGKTEAPVKEKEPVKQEKKEIPVTINGTKRGRRSLKDIAATVDLVQVPDDEILFRKQYYSIGEVAKMFRENQSLIRFWETEFDILQPRKNRKGDRFFRPVDIKNLVLIHDLLRRRKFTIEGAREYLKKNNARSLPGKAEEKFELIQSLKKIRGFLLELKAGL